MPVDTYSVERIEVFNGEENAMRILVQTMANVQKEAVVCADANSPAFSMGVEPIRKGYEDFKRREAKIRFITEITPNNLSYVKELLNYAEVRHIDAVKGNMALSETEYIATATLEGAKPITQTIYSNAKPVLEQQRYFFENLWNKAMPAEQRIVEIEQGIKLERTEIINGVGDTTDAILEVVANAKSKLDGCGDRNAPGRILSFQPYKKALLDAKTRGVKIRIITDIIKDNVEHCKELQKLAHECRHLEEIKINNGISDREYIASVISEQVSVPYPQVIYSNSKELVAEQSYIFETLWEKAFPAEQRIRELEEGIEPEFVQVITDGSKAASIMVEFAKSLRKTAKIILPNPRAMSRGEKLQIWKYLIDAANTYGAQIQVISPITEENVELARRIMNKAPSIKILAGIPSTAGLFIQDEERYFRVEYKNVEASEYADAVSNIIYSNSKNGVKWLKGLFETLWKQSELHEQLRMANEKLLLQDRLQKEFINIAAHELRTPIQPILGMAELKEPEFSNGKHESVITKDEMDMIVRNAKRLERLSSDILEIARIESGNLQIDVQEFNLNDMILPLVQDAKNQTSEGKVDIQYTSANIIIRADKDRLEQVIWNLLDNALKFTAKGTIFIEARKEDQNHVTVTVKDTGAGIDKEILPRLFGKFVTKSNRGTGLGLYISKSIIEAHGGTISGENNKDNIGANFTFTIPLK